MSNAGGDSIPRTKVETAVVTSPQVTTVVEPVLVVVTKTMTQTVTTTVTVTQIVVKTVEQSSVIDVVYDNQYFHVVPNYIGQASKSIDLTMYNLKYYNNEPQNLVINLLHSIVNAAKRDVRVRALVYKDVLKISPEAIEFLRDHGVEVRVVKDRKLHEKTIFIDDKIFVVGSHNITKAAARYNYKASVVLRILNDYLTKKIKRRFDEIWKESEPV